MAGIGEGGLNIAHEAVDRHLADGLGDKLAIKWLGKTGRVREFTYRQLADQTSRFAHLLQQFGIARGERVFGLAPRVPELYIAALGTMKAGAVFSPLFSAFGPEPVRTRMEIGDARALVTTKKLYDKTVAKWRHEMPNLRLILLVDGGEATPNENGVVGLEPALLAASAEFATVETDPEDMALLHFTSGTTGRPKGAIHVHQAVLSHHVTGAFALDLHRDDVFWCTADPGWVTGISYGMIAPLTNGVTMIVDEAEFDAARWYDLLRRERVTVWYTAPTAIRMLMRVGEAAFPAGGLPDLRFMASVGEPLNPEAVWWSQRVFGQPFHDNWWQTETGGIMIANTADMDIKPGSMGRPLPGLTAAIVNRHGDSVEEIVAPDTIGDLALRPGWPSMFRGYLHDDARYKKCFVDGWYITGDLATRDADGYFWFVGRADDLIKSAGHLIGPFEVESVLIEHPAVAEAGVIGKPDPVGGEMVKAFVTLKPGHPPSDELLAELQAHARLKLGSAVAPKEIEFVDHLPKTRSGKIMRRLLKARELGLPEGDTSTLEGDDNA